MAFIDACHSGAVGFGRGEGLIDQAGFQLPASVEPTKVIFTAGTGAQASQEDEQIKHGIFTYFLVNGIEGGAEDDDDDELVDLAELADYVIQGVRRHTQSAKHLSRQVPQLFSAEGLYAEDFPIALRVRAE